MLNGLAEQRLHKIKKKKEHPNLHLKEDNKPLSPVRPKTSPSSASGVSSSLSSHGENFTPKMNNIPTYDGTLEFRPYEFQVAGHVALLRTKSGRLFKPLKRQELWFYTIVGQAFPLLVPFMPEFMGCVEITVSQLRNLEGVLMESDDSTSLKDWNPWSVQMHRARLMEIREFQEPSYSYVVLQDLTYEYKKPAVLDLKMGTKQFGDNASLEKQQSKTLKCLTSTSSTLGFRISGLQKWDTTTNSYRHIHKYDGRKLNNTSTEQSLQEFFWNSDTGLRTDLILPVIAKTKELYKLLALPEASFRFYSTSLLLIYESDSDGRPKVDVRMIDFAHTFPRGEKEDDSGYLVGLNSLITMLERIVAKNTNPSPPSCNAAGNARQLTTPAMQYDQMLSVGGGR